MKLAQSHIKKLYEAVRLPDEPRWEKLFPQQKIAVRQYYCNVLEQFNQNPASFRRSKNSEAERLIDEMLEEVNLGSVE